MNFDYVTKRSSRGRSIHITVRHTGEVFVTAPRLMPEFLIHRFVHQKRDWIEKKVNDFKNHPVSVFSLMLRKRSRKDYLANKGQALKILKERLKYFNGHYGFAYKGIMIRDQKSRWGSCSAKGNINFNYKLILLPPELRDYVVVHELCHLKELNHSRKFWGLVAEAAPDYKAKRRKLKGIG